MEINPERPFDHLPDLPPDSKSLESRETVALLVRAHRALAELKGSVRQLPNPELLLNTVVLQEGKDSSEIENIVTTHDELYRAASVRPDQRQSRPAKEVLRYREAISVGLAELRKDNLITTNTLVRIVQTIKANDAGIRTIRVVIANPASGRVIYTPPDGEQIVRDKLRSLEQFIHTDHDLDPLIEMALIHYQFEAIHPFSDGNGRTGRILNSLYLIQQNLLDSPVLYLSKYILANRADYYRLLLGVTMNNDWLEWIQFMLAAIESTARGTLDLVNDITTLMNVVSQNAKKEMSTGYSLDLIQAIFRNPYCKIQHLVDADIASRVTASKYLSELERIGILKLQIVHRDKYFVNHGLLDIVSTNRIS